MRDIRYDTQRDVFRDPSRIKSRNESSYGEPRASSNSRRELNARLPRGDVTRKSIPIALRSAGGEAGRNICRDAGSWPMAIVGRNPDATRCSCMHARARARAHPLTGALAPRREGATDNSFSGSRKCRPRKIGRTRRGLNWSRDSRNRIATATSAAAAAAAGYLTARRGRFKEPDYYGAP